MVSVILAWVLSEPLTNNLNRLHTFFYDLLNTAKEPKRGVKIYEIV